jgi:hypothetical protein
MRASLPFLLLATLAHGVIVLPSRPSATFAHGVLALPSRPSAGPQHEHHILVSRPYINSIPPEKRARLSLKLHHRNQTQPGDAREAPSDAPDLGQALQHMIDPLYEFLTGMIDMLNQPRAETHASKRGRANSMLY